MPLVKRPVAETRMGRLNPSVFYPLKPNTALASGGHCFEDVLLAYQMRMVLPFPCLAFFMFQTQLKQNLSLAVNLVFLKQSVHVST